jgi:uncharacterized protein
MNNWAANWEKWKKPAVFVLLTFFITWLLDLFLWLRGGLTNAAVLALQCQMLIPAAAAFLCKFFIFPTEDSQPNWKSSPAKWFIYYYLAIFVLFLGASIFTSVKPDLIQTISPILLILTLIGMILWIVLRIIGKYDMFAGLKMAGGKPFIWLILGVGLVLFYSLQTGLNWLFKLGTPVNLQQLFPQLATQTLPDNIILLSMGLNTILIGPFLGILIAFGEEFGWRGYLLPELESLGRKKAALWVGIIWGLWHGPIIWMGYNYPGQPTLGTGMMILYTILLSYFLSYAVYKAKGIWIAAYLHALNNQVMSFFQGFVYAPKDNILSFGIGIFGILSFGIVIFFLLRSKIWSNIN